MTEQDSKSLRSRNAATTEADDRRHEPRFQATGEVRLLIGEPQQLSIPGRILDVSQHGMRVEHMYSALVSGAMLEIQTSTQTYTARVVWNRIKNDGVESGFYLL